MRCKVWPPLCNARDPQSPFPTTPSLIRLNCRVRFFVRTIVQEERREKKNELLLSGKIVCCKWTPFFLFSSTHYCVLSSRKDGRQKDYFFFFLVRFAGKGFPNDLSKQSAWKSNFSRWPLDFQPLCIFPSLFGFWKKDSEHVSSFFSVVIMCIKDIPQSLYLIIIIEKKARRLETSHFEKKVRKNNQRCQICRPFSPLPKKKSNIIIQKSVCFLHSNPFWP